MIINSTVINDNQYDIGLAFILKTDETKIYNINWNDVKQLTYIDDISEIGLVGNIIIHDDGGIYKQYFDSAGYIFLKFYIKDKQTDYIESILFDMIDIQPINAGTLSSGYDYNISLVEAFIGEGAIKSLKAFTIAENTSPESKNIHSLVEYAIKLLKCKLTIADDGIGTGDINDIENKIGGSVSTSSFDLFSKTINLNEAGLIKSFAAIDEKSIEYFKTNHPSDILGQNIFNNISTDMTITEFLQEINKNFYCPTTESFNENGAAASVSLEIGEPCTLRCENLAKITTIEKAHSVEQSRKIILRSIKDTFTECFRNNNVHEIILGENSSNINKKLKAKFTNNNFATNIGTFPINKVLTGKEWTDFIVLNYGITDNFSGKRYDIKSLCDLFDHSYLFDTRKNNIPINQKYASYGYNTKELLYNDENLSYASAAKTIKSFFTLNDTSALTLPGHIYRKCNEIVYIDNSLTKNINTLNPIQITFGNTLLYDYYYTTKVIHRFNGQKYENELYVCGFSYPNN